MRIFKANQPQASGFTLIELLVVMAIISVLTAMVLVNTGKNEDRDIRLEAERLKAFLRDVQNKSLTAEKISGASGKVCGFGVNWKSDTELQAYYIKTTDVSGNALDVDCSSVTKTFSDGDSSAQDTFIFKNGVTADSFEDLFFLSPHGEVYSGVNSLTGSDTAVITLGKGSLTLDITISGSGRIF